jgi:hypothetical protein
MRVWFRSLARILKIHSASASIGTSVKKSSPATRVPQDIVEIIVGYLSCDVRSLRACSLTCHSWYIAAVRHLHHTLVTPTYSRDEKSKFMWPGALSHMRKLGLLPLVKKFQVHAGRPDDGYGFSPKRLNRCVLHHFSALTNVQELGIDCLDIPKFMPRIQQYFKHFLPTVRSLVLREPKGSRRQIIYFIGLFQHLEDLSLLYDCYKPEFQGDLVEDPTLIPLFVPPLRGQLTMAWFTWVGLLEDMIELFGGIRFRRMDLFRVAGMWLLLDACAETLEILRLYPLDHGEDGFSGWHAGVN